jgi:hypothetical protein
VTVRMSHVGRPQLHRLVGMSAPLCREAKQAKLVQRKFHARERREESQSEFWRYSVEEFFGREYLSDAWNAREKVFEILPDLHRGLVLAHRP